MNIILLLLSLMALIGGLLSLMALIGGIHLFIMGYKNMDFSLLQSIFSPSYSKYIYMTIGASIIVLVLIK
jgi:uncharacterized membrane protein YuzA (DUF378 family)